MNPEQLLEPEHGLLLGHSYPSVVYWGHRLLVCTHAPHSSDIKALVFYVSRHALTLRKRDSMRGSNKKLERRPDLSCR
jgi:hypothetical protein